MVTVKKIFIIILTALASDSCLIARYNPFEQMRKHFEEMEKAFDDSFSQAATLKADPSSAMQLSIDEDPKSKIVKISVTHLETEIVDTEVNRNGNKLTIKTDHGSMIMHVKQNYLSVTMEEMLEHKEKDEKGAEKSMGSSYFSSSHGQTLGHRVDLKKPSIDYTKDSKTLTISIPYAQTEEEGSTKVPVNIK